MPERIELRDGDLFKQSDLDAIGHGVNCRGVMGAGIARPFSALDGGAMYAAYKELCYNNELAPGDIFPWRMPSGKWVYNIASQYNPGADARVTALYEGVFKAVRHAETNGVKTIGLPRIGCGIGGLNWYPQVVTTLNTVQRNTDVVLVVVTKKEPPL